MSIGTPAFLSKLCFLILAVAALNVGASGKQLHFAAQVCLLLFGLLFLGARLYSFVALQASLENPKKVGSFSKKINPAWAIDRWLYVFFWIPALLWALSLRIEQLPKIAEPPAIWRQLESLPIHYNRSLVADVKISKQIGLGRFLVDVRLLRREIQSKKRYTKNARSFPYRKAWRIRHYKKTKPKDASHVFLSSNNNFHKWKKYKGRKKKFRKRKYKKKRRQAKWHLQKSFAAGSKSAHVFPAILVLSKKDGLYKGCRLLMRIYGRGVPRLLSGNFAAWVRSQAAQSYWRASAKYHLIKTQCPKPDFRSSIRLELLQLLREKIKHSEVRNLMQALLFGRSSYLSRGLKKRIRKLGILHLFAASGLHLGIFYLCFYLPLGNLLGKRHPLVLLLSLLPCGFAVWFLDFPVSIVRAFLFLSLHSLFLLLHKRLLRSHLILGSMILLLFYSPMDFLGIGSLLSFGAVTGILLFFPVLDSFVKDRNFLLRLLWKQYALGVSASIFTIPILLYYFRAYAFLSPLANFVFVPLMGLLLPLLYLSTALSFLGTFFASLSGALFYLIEYAFIGFLSLVELWPGDMFYMQFPHFWNIALLASMLLCLSLLYLSLDAQRCKKIYKQYKKDHPKGFMQNSTKNTLMKNNLKKSVYRCREKAFFAIASLLLVLGLLLLGPPGFWLIMAAKQIALPF